MDAYHSQFNQTNDQKVCGIVILPLKTNVKGPAWKTEENDVIDEALKYFRANIFFKNY